MTPVIMISSTRSIKLCDVFRPNSGRGSASGYAPWGFQRALHGVKRLTYIDVHAVFLSFNYTSALGDLYAVPDAQVLHVHGKADMSDSELIFGHAWFRSAGFWHAPIPRN